jgi:hypothetical protein
MDNTQNDDSNNISSSHTFNMLLYTTIRTFYILILLLACNIIHSIVI